MTFQFISIFFQNSAHPLLLYRVCSSKVLIRSIIKSFKICSKFTEEHPCQSVISEAFPRCVLRKRCSENTCSKFTEEHPCQSVFDFNKVVYNKITLRHGCNLLRRKNYSNGVYTRYLDFEEHIHFERILIIITFD